MSRDVGRVGKPTGLSQAEPQEGLGPSGFDPSRLSVADRLRLKNAGSNFGSPQFSRLACEWMGVQGLAKPRREKGRWALTALGRQAQGAVLARDSDGSPEGRDATRLGAEHDSAGPKDIAQTASEPNP